MPVNKIVSFGDSFIYGYEMTNNDYGEKSWPGIAAEQLDLDFERRAIPGCSNESITRQILDYYSYTKNRHHLAVINWTWIHRWEFHNQHIPVNITSTRWGSIGIDGVVNSDLWVSGEEAECFWRIYKKYMTVDELWSKHQTLQTVAAVVHFLERHSIPYVQTYMDKLMFDTKWHAPGHVKSLQDLVKPSMQNFGKDVNFLDWSRKQGFSITDPGLHPLEDAHEAAAKLWVPVYKQTIEKYEEKQ